MKLKGITLKIFTITSVLLILSALIIYLTFYFLLPTYYYNYKSDRLNSGVTNLIKEIEYTSIDKVDDVLNSFVQTYNVRMMIHNQESYSVYFPVDRQFNEAFNRGKHQIPGRNQLNRHLLHEEWNSSDVILITETLFFQNEEYTITVVAPLQPIDEASNVIIMFLPYMLIVIGTISIIGSYFYSNLLSKPLIHLNKTAKKMATLDFSEKSNVKTNDELGELSKSLNQLSTNLQKNIKQLQEANIQLKDDIQKEREQEEKRREFIATISHELKTPITAVSGQLEGMIYEIGAFKDRDTYLKKSYDIMKEMEKLVYEILDISQLESFNFTPDITSINFSLLIEKTLKQFQYFADEKNIKIQLSLEADLYINGDEKLISKVIANVLSNAVKYSNEGAQVKVTLSKINQKIHLNVLNTCTYIDENQLHKIFEPFYRLEKSRNRKTGGSGLGLYIVKSILDMHNINYSIENVQQGVLFKMIINSQ